MALAQGVNKAGRKIGYSVHATCDQRKPQCRAKIDRGLAFVCGGQHDGGESGCGRYFCYRHLLYLPAPAPTVQLCIECAMREAKAAHLPEAKWSA